MKTLNKKQYQSLHEGAEVLAADGHGEKVLKLNDGRIMKLFRRKRLFSSALIYPYGKRFFDNANQLIKLGIPTVNNTVVFRVPSISRIAVVYQPLPGYSLDDLIQNNHFSEKNIQQFAAFLAKLHKLGVYFRSIHLGNVILTPENKLGLIDVSDMKVYRKTLSTALCARNLQHFCRYPEHVSALFPKQQASLFLECYLNALDINTKKKALYRSALEKQLKKSNLKI